MVIPLTEKRSWMQLLKQCAIGCAAIAVLTFVAYQLHLPVATAGFIYLLVVVITSISYGIWQATLHFAVRGHLPQLLFYSSDLVVYRFRRSGLDCADLVSGLRAPGEPYLLPRAKDGARCQLPATADEEAVRTEPRHPALRSAPSAGIAVGAVDPAHLSGRRCCHLRRKYCSAQSRGELVDGGAADCQDNLPYRSQRGRPRHAHHAACDSHWEHVHRRNGHSRRGRSVDCQLHRLACRNRL